MENSQQALSKLSDARKLLEESERENCGLKLKVQHLREQSLNAKGQGSPREERGTYSQAPDPWTVDTDHHEDHHSRSFLQFKRKERFHDLAKEEDALRRRIEIFKEEMKRSPMAMDFTRGDDMDIRERAFFPTNTLRHSWVDDTAGIRSRIEGIFTGSLSDDTDGVSETGDSEPSEATGDHTDAVSKGAGNVSCHPENAQQLLTLLHVTEAPEQQTVAVSCQRTNSEGVAEPSTSLSTALGIVLGESAQVVVSQPSPVAIPWECRRFVSGSLDSVTVPVTVDLRSNSDPIGSQCLPIPFNGQWPSQVPVLPVPSKFAELFSATSLENEIPSAERISSPCLPNPNSATAEGGAVDDVEIESSTASHVGSYEDDFDEESEKDVENSEASGQAGPVTSLKDHPASGEPVPRQDGAEVPQNREAEMPLEYPPVKIPSDSNDSSAVTSPSHVTSIDVRLDHDSPPPQSDTEENETGSSLPPELNEDINVLSNSGE